MPSNAQIKELVARERARLRKDAGLEEEVSHFRRPRERPFVREEREEVTLLFGGLTLRHETLIHSGLEGLGYRPQVVPTPRKADFQSGKEYGNNGQCNPTYFTVGALVNYLKELRDRHHIPTQEILDKYVFLTAGACGPCRFGMYEAEYRLALRNSGFDGFRVLIFQQTGGLSQDQVAAGIDYDPVFFLTILDAILIGDLLNEVAYHIRPYEIDPGATNRVVDRCLDLMANRIREKSAENAHRVKSDLLSRALTKVTPFDDPRHVAAFLNQLTGDHYLAGLRQCARWIDDQVEVDYARARPVVKVTGEFWAQTTEGDGNFQMFPFLESQGAEVLVEPVTTWIHYLLAQERSRIEDRAGLLDPNGPRNSAGVFAGMRRVFSRRRQLLNIALAERVLNREYERMRKALGGTAHPQVNQLQLQRLGHPYYNRKSGGGEGHLEVAKTIYYGNKSLAHMVLSLKPFGCMPSTQSDGAQAAVVSHYPDLIYLPIETSGEGDLNAHSRVQMALGEAKIKCRDEFKAQLASTGFTLDEVRRAVAGDRRWRRPLRRIPPHDGVVGKGARFVLEVGKHLQRTRPRRPVVAAARSGP